MGSFEWACSRWQVIRFGTPKGHNETLLCSAECHRANPGVFVIFVPVYEKSSKAFALVDRCKMSWECNLCSYKCNKGSDTCKWPLYGGHYSIHLLQDLQILDSEHLNSASFCPFHVPNGTRGFPCPFVGIFETGSHCVGQLGMELTMQHRPASNS